MKKPPTLFLVIVGFLLFLHLSAVLFSSWYAGLVTIALQAWLAWSITRGSRVAAIVFGGLFAFYALVMGADLFITESSKPFWIRLIEPAFALPFAAYFLFNKNLKIYIDAARAHHAQSV